jgi:hypothetical protein
MIRLMANQDGTTVRIEQIVKKTAGSSVKVLMASCNSTKPGSCVAVANVYPQSYGLTRLKITRYVP